MADSALYCGALASTSPRAPPAPPPQLPPLPLPPLSTHQRLLQVAPGETKYGLKGLVATSYSSCREGVNGTWWIKTSFLAVSLQQKADPDTRFYLAPSASLTRVLLQCVLVIRESFTREYGSRVFHSGPCRPLCSHFELNQLSLITRKHCNASCEHNIFLPQSSASWRSVYKVASVYSTNSII